MKQSVTFEGVSWNVDCVGDQTEGQFVQEHLNNQYRQYDVIIQKKLLKETYRLIKLNNRGGIVAAPK